MLITHLRTISILIATLGGLTVAPDARPAVQVEQQTQRPSDEYEAQLADVLRNIEGEDLAKAAAGQPRSRQSKELLIRGAVNFFRPFPGGNGRSCATCHVPRDGFSLSPVTVEARWQRLQRQKRFNPD